LLKNIKSAGLFPDKIKATKEVSKSNQHKKDKPTQEIRQNLARRKLNTIFVAGIAIGK